MDKLRDKRFLLGVSLAAILAMVLYLLIFQDKEPDNEVTQDLTNTQKTPSTQTISGNLLVSGYIPDGSTIQVLARKLNESNFQQVYSTQASPTTTWSYTQAEDGTPYELKAQLTTPHGTYESEIITLVAPAQNEDMRILSKAPSQKAQTAKISGNLSINGLIPQNATVTLAQKSPSNTQFTNFGSNIQAKENLNWNWDSAKVGNTYEVIAYLVSSGSIIGTSNTATTTAPATDVSLTINSQNTQAITSPASISGRLNINGVVPEGSFASLGVREVGESAFNLLGTNITARDEVEWSWNSAETGVTYEIQAYIQTGGTPIAQSEILTVTAPAKEQILTLNINFEPDPPKVNSLSTECAAKNNKDRWQVKITMNSDNSLNNVAQYHLQFGTIQNSTEFIDSKITPADPNAPESLTTDYILTPGTTYYAKYAYQKNNFSEFSPFSPHIKVTCN